MGTFDVHNAKKSRVSALRPRQVDNFQFNFLWHFVGQQNFIFRWFYARTLLNERLEISIHGICEKSIH